MTAGEREQFLVSYPGGELRLGQRTLLMGILNVTPDSFSDGGRFLEPEVAIEHGLALAENNADIIDVGGESTRPGALAVSAEEEIRRVNPVIRALAARVDVPISIDTYKSKVAEEALDAGARMVNDITALNGDPGMAPLVAGCGVPVVLMHIKGTPRDMQVNPTYDDVVSEIIEHLRLRLEVATRAGVAEERILVDPGVGFGKTVYHNLEIIRRLAELRVLGRPILVGPSRKSFIGKIVGTPADERLLGTAASVTACILNGAHVLRVHDIAEMKQVALMADALRGDGCKSTGGGSDSR